MQRAMRWQSLSTVLLIQSLFVFAAEAGQRSAEDQTAEPSDFAAEQGQVMAEAGGLTAVSPNRYYLENLLQQEARMTTVSEAMAIKRSGLQYVQDLQDFEILSRSAFANPSDSYSNTLADFIVQHLPQFFTSYDRVDFLSVFESRTTLVSQSMAIKRAGMRLVRNIYDFEILIRSAFANPSQSYMDQRSQFIADYIGRAVMSGDSIALILRIEAQTRLVTQAIAVKTAGLRALRYSGDFWQLSQYAFVNPSASYQQAVRDFIIRYSAQYP